jgi:copper chaperone
MQYQFYAGDMTCNHCKMRIEKAISSLKDIESIQVNLDKKQVTVSGDTSEKDIRKAIQDSGYTVSDT